MQFWIAIIWMILGFYTQNIFGKESEILVNAYDRVSIISNDEFYHNQERILFGLRIQLKPGWHTYWKNPGDAGDATSVQLLINENQKKITPNIEWPVPQRLKEDGLTSYIYQDDVILPFYVFIDKHYQNQDLHFHFKASWLICSTVCKPEEGSFVLNIPYNFSYIYPSKESGLLQNTLKKRPEFLNKNIFISPTGTLWANQADIPVHSIQNLWFMPEKAGFIDHNKKQVFELDSNYFQLKLPLLSQQVLTKPLTGILAVQDQNLQTYYWLIHPKVQNQYKVKDLNLFLIIGCAFIGGFLLNFMPCVFPVMAMKLLSLSRMGKTKISYRHKSGLVYALGVLCSFIAIDLIFILLRWMGNQFSWGFQFQSISFLILLCWLFFVIALNFLNVFIISISFSGFKTQLSSTYIADFLTGIFVVIIATPCTAPFMGIAIAAALNSSFFESFILFTMMGLGLACPFLILAYVSYLIKFLPKPGPWMETLKQFLAFPLFISCVWLIWIINQYQQPFILLIVLLGGVLIGFGGWLYGKMQHSYYRTFNPFSLFFLRFLLVMILVLLGLSIVFVHYDQKSVQISDENHLAFSFKKIEELRAKHQPVFVNITASWCLTCLVNDKVALSNSRVKKYFRAHHIYYMFGDWTHYDHEIRVFLKQFGREGVPLYIYYPSDGDPRILPQILTPDLVLKRIKNNK